MSKPTVLLDVDGVILNSNEIKERHIAEAARAHVADDVARDFVAYFTRLNGVPRGAKTNAYFGAGSETAAAILAHYNRLNAARLGTIPFTEGAEAALVRLSAHARLVALSGAEEAELVQIFAHKGITRRFAAIHGGPVTKPEHVRAMDLSGVACFVGDSRVDYDTAAEAGIPFVFMHAYTQFADWSEFFKDKPEVRVVATLADLTLPAHEGESGGAR